MSAVSLLNNEFMKFIHSCSTPYHVVQQATQLLKSAGYVAFSHDNVSSSKDPNTFPELSYSTFGGSFVAVRRSSSKKNADVLILVAHTDSPCLRLKPVSNLPANDGLHQLAVQTYGGGIWHSWLDRDLRASGLALVRRNNAVFEQLFDTERSVCRIPNVAIHLLNTHNESFSVNKETHLKPIFYCDPITSENKNIGDELSSSQHTSKQDKLQPDRKTLSPHDNRLIEEVARLIDCFPDDIIDLDAYLSDATLPVLGGLHNDFIFAPRLDNLTSCFAALQAIIQAVLVPVNVVIALFNHEEIGSTTNEGASSERFSQLLSAMGISLDGVGGKHFIVSLDAAHAFHPNYSDLYEANHRPHLLGGPVIKTNANGRYATTLKSRWFIKNSAELASVPTQEFVVRNDMRCGSTIGPILASTYGIDTVDIGLPILSMHSIREMMSTNSLHQLLELLKALLINYHTMTSQYHNDFTRSTK